MIQELCRLQVPAPTKRADPVNAVLEGLIAQVYNMARRDAKGDDLTRDDLFGIADLDVKSTLPKELIHDVKLKGYISMTEWRLSI